MGGWERHVPIPGTGSAGKSSRDTDRFRACAEALDLKYLTCPVVGACVEAVFLRQPPLSGRALEPGSDDKSDANPDDVPERSQGATHDLQSWLRRPITPRPVELQCEA